MYFNKYDINVWCVFLNSFNNLFRTDKNLELARVLLSQSGDAPDKAVAIIKDIVTKSNCAGKRKIIEEFIKAKYNLTYCTIYDGYDTDTTVLYTTDEYVPLNDILKGYTLGDNVPENEQIKGYTIGEQNGELVKYKIELIQSELSQSEKFYTDNILRDVGQMSLPHQVFEIIYL